MKIPNPSASLLAEQPCPSDIIDIKYMIYVNNIYINNYKSSLPLHLFSPSNSVHQPLLCTVGVARLALRLFPGGNNNDKRTYISLSKIFFSKLTHYFPLTWVHCLTDQLQQGSKLNLDGNYRRNQLKWFLQRFLPHTSHSAL